MACKLVAAMTRAPSGSPTGPMEPLHRPKEIISSSVNSVKPGTRPSIFSSFSS